MLSDNNQNRISKDRFGNDVSRISKNVDFSGLHSQDRDDIESCKLTLEDNESTHRTEASQIDRNEEYKEIRRTGIDLKTQENQLAKSERVQSKSSKSTTYYNYLNNRMSVRIK
jgi:hypothetical protein